MKDFLQHYCQQMLVLAVLLIMESGANHLAAQQAYYVGDSFNLNPPSVAGTIDAAAWTVDVKGVSVSGNANGAHVTVDAYFNGTATIDCQYAYRKYGGDYGHGHSYYQFTCRRSDVKLNETNLRLKVGQTHTLKYTNSSGRVLRSIMWETSDYKVADFDGNTKSYEQTVDIYAKKVGECTITFYPNCGCENQTCNITVYSDPATAISLEPQEIVMKEGETKYISAHLTPDDAYAEITWSSSNEQIAKVNSYGCVTAVSGGTTIITAKTDNGLTAQASVKVIPLPQSVTIKSSTDIFKGYSCHLIPTFSPIESTAKLKWVSSDTKVASVDENGKVRAKNNGSASITVTTENGKTSTCLVHVSNPSDDMNPRDIQLRINALRSLINNSVSHIK